MRLAIILGLIFIAWAINYDLVESKLQDFSLIIIVIILAAMDTIEFLVKLFKSNK